LRLAAGVIILKNDHILLVHEKNHWSLPKGKREKNETMQQTAIREAKEETGLDVELISTAFVSEFVKDNNRHYLQVYYEATPVHGEISINDPDGDIDAVQYVPLKELENYLSFKPRLQPLKQWLHKRKTSYHFFDLTHEK